MKPDGATATLPPQEVATASETQPPSPEATEQLGAEQPATTAEAPAGDAALADATPAADAPSDAAPAPEVPVGSAPRQEPSQDALNATLIERLHRIERQRKDVRKAQERVDELAAELKEAKSRLDTETTLLLEIIDEKDEGPGLFGTAAKKEPVAAGDGGTKEGAPTATADADPDAWRKVTLKELGLVRPKLVEALTGEDLTTMGAIADYTASGKSLRDLRGVGAGAVQLIDDKIAAYWTAHPRPEPAKGPRIENCTIVSGTGADVTAAATMSTEGIIRISDLGLNAGDIEGAWTRDIRSSISKRRTPSVQILGLLDKESRFQSADFVVIGPADGKPPGTWMLLPTYPRTAWMDRIKRYESETKKDPPGDLAGGTVKDTSTGNELYVGGDDEALYLSTGPEIVTADMLRLPAGEIEAGCHINLIAEAPYSIDEKSPPELHKAFTLSDDEANTEFDHVATPAPAGFPANVYTLRPLLEPSGGAAVENDPYCNRLVKWKDKVWAIGAEAGAFFVQDGAA